MTDSIAHGLGADACASGTKLSPRLTATTAPATIRGRTRDEDDGGDVADTGDVLLMEDDDDIRETLRFLLEEADYTVLEAPDGVAGLSLLRASQQRLVVLVDYRMPRLDGISVLREVSTDRRLARHVYLLVTANYDQLPSGTPEVLDALAVSTLRKPFDIDTVLAAVRSARTRLLKSSAPRISLQEDARALTPHDQSAQEG